VNFVKLDVMNLIGLLINELLKLDVRGKKYWFEEGDELWVRL